MFSNEKRSGFYVLFIANRTPVWYKCSGRICCEGDRGCAWCDITPGLAGAWVLSDRKPTLLIGTSQARAVVVPVDEYERLVAVYDWHERLLKGA